MPVKKPARARTIHLFVGTRKGAFIFRSDLRRKSWRIQGPFLTGAEINHFIRDQRTGALWATHNNPWWGNQLQVSLNGGKTWRRSDAGLGFAADRRITLNRLWVLQPDRSSRPDTLWCGVDPGTMFRSDDGGKNWFEVKGLTEHPTRDKWQPGAGGLMVHTIIPDPQNENRMFVAISAAGCFRSDDDGAHWHPMNRGVRADFLPNKFPEVGQCVHHLIMDPDDPSVLYQQNHCGMYRSDDAGEHWKDISKGLPSRFGFPIVAHPRIPGVVYLIPETGSEQRFVPRARFCVWRSRQGGRSWQRLTRGLPQNHAYVHVYRQAMTHDSCDEPGIYIGTSGGEIYYSRNSGDDWEVLHSNLPTILSLETSLI
jgi:photosystem II stability/assembly factor-like uncharacterized protein